MTAEHFELAKLLHELYEQHSKTFGWETQKSCQVDFRDLPEKNKTVMMAVAESILKFYVSKEKIRRLVNE
jgi:hypothetical protein